MMESVFHAFLLSVILVWFSIAIYFVYGISQLIFNEDRQIQKLLWLIMVQLRAYFKFGVDLGAGIIDQA